MQRDMHGEGAERPDDGRRPSGPLDEQEGAGSVPVRPREGDQTETDDWHLYLEWAQILENLERCADSGTTPPESDIVVPDRIREYRITRLLKVTRYKELFLARHERMDRDVVVKVARPGFRLILDEARILARLDHPGIVKIYDAGTAEDGRHYLVEQSVDGPDLKDAMAARRFSDGEAAGLTAAVAEALHHVHTRGVFHRDIKPANVLIPSGGRPLVTDFGLALTESDVGHEERQGGTVAYMSPEQARHEGHLVDGRTDVYSLGIVLYELLTGRPPFVGSTVTSVLEQVRKAEVRPPRQIRDSIPKELERICLKATSKRITDRYNTARDLADDLRDFLAKRKGDAAAVAERVDVGPSVDSGEAGDLPAEEATGRIVPKGLRSYGSEDAGFFLDLLPGPRDRDGLPPAIGFWKARIEATDPERTFRAGVMYGPSGCGKSSLLKAGLLPRLQKEIDVMYLEASSEGTEGRLRARVARKWPVLSPDFSLTRVLTAIRRRKVGTGTRKILIVIDQFEQWLSGIHREALHQTTELAQALRQCDGRRLQCLLLVRDDFWMGTTRFMSALEIPLEEGTNTAAVDLFDPGHARSVLAAFGHAYGALSDPGRGLSREETLFLDRAVEGLAEQGHVIPVRLALFAQMMRDRPWSPRTLRTFGGTLGVGVAFLEETFDSSRASPECRFHRRAAMRVLKALLPRAGTEIKATPRSTSELQAACGYARRPRDFTRLMGVLDRDLRLVTPVDPQLSGADPGRDTPAETLYQLTHEYLIRPIEEWSTRRLRETRRGKAALLLEERAASWSVRPQRRQLPSWLEWLNILIFTRRRHRTALQRAMLRAAAMRHLSAFAAIALLVVLAFGGVTTWRNWKIEGLLEEAGSLRRDGPESWPEACALVEAALQTDPHHLDVRQWISDTATVGRLAIDVVDPPPGVTVRFRIEPAGYQSSRLGLPCTPYLLGVQDVESGDEVSLGLGHYKVTPMFDGAQRPDLQMPICITQIEYVWKDGGWKRLRRVPPGEISLVEPTEEDVPGETRSFFFGERFVLGPLRLPRSVLEDYKYVNPGPYFRSDTDFSKPRHMVGDSSDEEGAGKTITIFTEFRLVEDSLERGFLIAENPTSVRDFARWFADFGGAYCDWMVENERILGERTTLRKLKAAVRYVRLELQLQYWLPKLPAGIDPQEIRSSDDLMDIVFADELARFRAKWEARRKRMEAKLEEEPVKTRPVGHVDYFLALAYARTHRPVVCGELRAWLESEIAKSGQICAKLEEISRSLKSYSGQAFPLELVGGIQLGTPEGLEKAFAPHSVMDDYTYTLYYHVFYAAQIPSQQVIEWARQHANSLPPAIRSELGAIEQGLSQPHQWLHELSGEGRARIYNPVVHLYAMTAYPYGYDTRHFLDWLATRIRREEDRARNLEHTLERLALLQADQVVRDLPWQLRLEYGWSLGYDMPDARQWEKAFRGPDDREFPWGRHLDETVTGLTDGPEPLEQIEVTDVSPHRVLRLGGQTSEWVRSTFGVVVGDYLKGGNYRFEPSYANGGYLFSLPRGASFRWTGIRVIRELRPPAR